jgi:NodT family efflux transporter outer membrane factor (OMF) lipoprotein
MPRARNFLLQPAAAKLVLAGRFLLFSLFLAGCAVGPNYIPPKNEVENWQSAKSGQMLAFSEKTPEALWWQSFSDPLLNKYMELVAKHNKELLMAEANIREARALSQVAASKLFPWIGADLNASRSDYSKNGPLYAGGLSGLSLQAPKVQNLFNAFFDASWELDLFGKTRREVEASQAEIAGAQERKNDLMVSLMAETAKNYIGIRNFQKQLYLIEETIRLLEQNLQIVQKNVEQGYQNRLSLEAAEAELAGARARRPEAVAEIYRSIFALGVLTGQLPEALLKELLAVQPLPTPPAKIAIGLRSDLIRRRPDVRLSERLLAAATAKTGVAVANFFPTISLDANLGLQALKLANLFKLSSRTWQYGGDVFIPLFEGGNLSGNLKAKKAAQAAAAANYQRTVLKALEEAESSLVAYSESQRSELEIKEKWQRSEQLMLLTLKQHEQGLVKLQNLLDAKRNLVLAEEDLLQNDAKVLLNLIALYKALGGGWQINLDKTNPIN